MMRIDFSQSIRASVAYKENRTAAEHSFQVSETTPLVDHTFQYLYSLRGADVKLLAFAHCCGYRFKRSRSGSSLVLVQHD